MQQSVDEPGILTTDKLVHLMLQAEVSFLPGLTQDEFQRIEDLGIVLGPEVTDLLTFGLPDGPGWVDWRQASGEELRLRCQMPVVGILDAVSLGTWWEGWGSRPTSRVDAQRLAEDFLAHVPPLVPIYGHRFMSALHQPSPVFSVSGADVVVCGQTVAEYLSAEFLGHRVEWAPGVYVPFWSDLALSE